MTWSRMTSDPHRRSALRPLTPLLLILALTTASGCGKESQPVPVYPVTGKVTYGAKPAAGVRVYLLPTSAPLPPVIPMNPRAVTAADGTFTISTYADGDGAPEGGYQIILHWPLDTPPEEEAPDFDRFLGWYDAKRSKLTVQVKAERNTLPPFNLPIVTSPPPISEGVPGRN